MRWRNVKDAEGNDVLDDEGNPVRQSNARFVKWSDGRCVPVVRFTQQYLLVYRAVNTMKLLPDRENCAYKRSSLCTLACHCTVFYCVD